ncbi:MAG: hypothetical protein HY608_09805 [Planctomycetes bacterium]|nr:hypothetical protein [Planctomycetota bacterium]
MPRPYIRRKLVIDRSFQLHYLVVLLILGVGVIALAGGAYLWVRGQASTGALAGMAIPTEILRTVLILDGAYILVVSLLMGAYTVFHSHRVAGPAFRLTRCVKQLQYGDYDTPIGVRKGDYLQEMASGLETLRAKLATRRAVIASLLREAEKAGVERSTLDAMRKEWGIAGKEGAQ